MTTKAANLTHLCGKPERVNEREGGRERGREAEQYCVHYMKLSWG